MSQMRLTEKEKKCLLPCDKVCCLKIYPTQSPLSARIGNEERLGFNYGVCVCWTFRGGLAIFMSVMRSRYIQEETDTADKEGRKSKFL